MEFTTMEPSEPAPVTAPFPHGLIDALEALLFVADAPATLNALALATGLAEGQIEQALEILERKLGERGSLQLVQIAGGYQLSTKPEYAELIARFLKPQGQKLGRSLMESLAIIAYRQPITIGELDAIRGVQSDYGVRTLLERRFIREVGRKHAPGRPVLYGTTQQFLHQFNLKDISQLPRISLEGEAGEQGSSVLDFVDV